MSITVLTQLQIILNLSRKLFGLTNFINELGNYKNLNTDINILAKHVTTTYMNKLNTT